MSRLLAGVVALSVVTTTLLAATPLFAQSGVSVKQSGASVNPNTVPWWISNGVIGSQVTAADSPVTSFGVTSNGSAGICVNSDRITANNPGGPGRNQLCLGVQTSGPATISLQNQGAASAQALNFVVNGVTATFPSPSSPLGISSGGTGATTVAGAQANLGLGTIAVQNANAVAITGGTITGLPNPTNSSDAATKAYADALASGLTIIAPSRLATAAVLPNTPTYSNGASGVGATLTAGSNSTLTVDGTVANLSDVVLVNNQAAPAQNGIYTVTTAGGGVPWVLTRATYFNQASNMTVGKYTLINGGTTNINTSWVLSATVTTVGTTAVAFNQFSATSGVSNLGGLTGSIACGTGINCAAATVSLAQSPVVSGAVTSTVNLTGTTPLGSFIASSPNVSYFWNVTGQPADQKNWDAAASGGVLQFRAVNDANTAANPWMTVTRGTGATVSSVLMPNLSGVPVIPDNFCTVDRTGALDMTSCINSTIAAAKPATCGAAGNAVVVLRAGTYLINGTAVPKSCVTIRGDGRGKTILLTNNAAPFGPPAGQQLVHFNMSGITFKESGSIPTAVPMTFPNIQDSVLSNLGFTGYTTGGIMKIATSAVSSFDDTNAIWNNSNSIFNYFNDWISDGSAIGISEAGHYGSTPTASPANSSNVPDQVVTQNRYDNIYIWNCTNRCLTFVKAVDSEFLTNIFVGPSSNSAIVAQLGDDNANFPGNNYVALIRLQVTVSLKSPATSGTFFRAGDWTYGHEIDLNTDAAPSAITLDTAQGSVTQFKIHICGINPLTTFIDAATFNTNRLCLDNNAGTGGGDGQGTYYRYENGSSALPVVGFTNDITNGLYLPVVGEAAFSKSLRIDGHIVSGALSAPTLTACGGSPSFVGTASDTAGQIQTGSGSPTACTLNFGAAYVNTPSCVFTPVGSAAPGLLISSNSNAAITLTFSSAAKLNYTCIAQPTG